MGKNGSQEEFEVTPSPDIRNKILAAIKIKTAIGNKHKDLLEAQDDIRKMMKDEKKENDHHSG